MRVVLEVKQTVQIPSQVIAEGNDLLDQVDGLSVILSP